MGDQRHGVTAETGAGATADVAAVAVAKIPVPKALVDAEADAEADVEADIGAGAGAGESWRGNPLYREEALRAKTARWSRPPWKGAWRWC